MNILGLACHYHDSGACVVKDGVLVAASSEERFNRQKNSSDFPVYAINSCLQDAGITIYDIDYVCFYEKPYLKFSRVIVDHLRSFPFSLGNFIRNVPQWLQDRLIIPMTLKQEIGFEKEKDSVLFIKHHLSHAASAFYPSPFEQAAIITADGVGEWASTTFGVGRGNKIEVLGELVYPDSLGLIYSAVTTHLGFWANRGEGKVMGLAAYGKPTYMDQLNSMVDVKPDGSFRLDTSFFGFNKGKTMYSKKFLKIFGPARVPESGLEQRHFDIAHSLQKFTEERLIAIANHVHKISGMDNLVLGGGIFLNCVANHKILEHTPFKNVFIQPAAGDSGGCIGAALYAYHGLLGNSGRVELKSAALGPESTTTQIKRAFAAQDTEYTEYADDELFKLVAGAIADDKIIGWVQGRMEFGPRALGHRSILANPCSKGMKDYLNEQVKKREGFRPYAPAVLEENALEYFELKNLSAFMLLSPKVVPGMQERIPAVTHVDGTARVQTVNREQEPRFWGLIKAFGDITGVPVLLNTSFNLRGEPIVNTPEDAISCFNRTNMDMLVIGNCVAVKK